jgi:hypothetical protein
MQRGFACRLRKYFVGSTMSGKSATTARIDLLPLLENKIAPITGASSLIGRAIAFNLARDAHVFLTGRNAECLNEVAF